MTLHVKTKYKDTVFRALFLIKENLLSLYNALNDSDAPLRGILQWIGYTAGAKGLETVRCVQGAG